jgi:deoxynucleotide monophosphate kinase-like protein
MLIAFSGLKGSGKDTAAEVLTNEYGFTKIAFADPLREMLLALDPYVELAIQYSDGTCSKGFLYRKLSKLVTEFGWDKLKREVPEVRRLMQKIGTEAGRGILGDNIWVDTLTKRYPDLSDYTTRYVITDCRFDNEVEFVRNQGGMVIWVERPGVESDGHASESTSIKDLASVVLHNDETIQELQEDVRLMLFLRGVETIE